MPRRNPPDIGLLLTGSRTSDPGLLPDPVLRELLGKEDKMRKFWFLPLLVLALILGLSTQLAVTQEPVSPIQMPAPKTLGPLPSWPYVSPDGRLFLGSVQYCV